MSKLQRAFEDFDGHVEWSPSDGRNVSSLMHGFTNFVFLGPRAERLPSSVARLAGKMAEINAGLEDPFNEVKA